MKGRLIDMSFSREGRQRITVEILGDFRDSFDKLKDADVNIEIKKFRMKRSLSANGYFHVLVNQIASAQGVSDELVKKRLVIEYGALKRDADGRVVGFKLPISVDIDDIYPYAKRFDTRTENGVQFACYLVYKPTHEMDTKEFTRLIDGAIDEAKELGIDTDTPEQVARYKEDWAKHA